MKLIGLMSGTSVDGIDAALVEIEGAPPRLQWKLRAFACVPWEPELRQAILDVCRPDAPLQTVTVLNFLVGEKFAAAARAAAEAASVSLREVAAIASHGQTIWHQPTALEVGGHRATGTLQIGEPAVIAARTGCKVVADFRMADMARGGQGAPLVPFADYALFASETETRVAVNLGGIANLTYLPAGGGMEEIMAFDTGPGNMLLDALTRQLTLGKKTFDAGGEIAGGGKVVESLLSAWRSDSYFALPPPKSTGREKFGEAFAAQIIEQAKSLRISTEDALATATAFTAESIAEAITRWLPGGNVQTIILGGGGVHNRTLVRRLTERFEAERVTTCAEFGLPDDAKEAVAFAFLGYETLHGRSSNVPSATGASGPAVLGKIVLPPPSRDNGD